jgi:head-tail adaptor
MSTLGGRRHLVTVEAPSAPVPDGYGGYTETWQPLDPPTWDCSIEPATARTLEELGAGTVISQASHIVKGNYHAGLTTKARIVFEGRILNIVKVTNPEERDRESHLVCAELLS